jgi:hypothetical protein
VATIFLARTVGRVKTAVLLMPNFRAILIRAGYWTVHSETQFVRRQASCENSASEPLRWTIIKISESPVNAPIGS